MLVLIVFIIIYFTYHCLPLSVCPLSESATEKLEKHKRSIFCNQTLDCYQLEKDFGYDYNNLVVVHYDQRKLSNFTNITLLLEMLSKCGVHVLTVTDTIGSESEIVCTKKFRGTLVIELSENEFIDSYDKANRTNSSCFLVPENDETKFVVNLLTLCPNTTWITNNFLCNQDENDKSLMLRVCQGVGCELSERMSLEEAYFRKHLKIATSQDYAPFVKIGMAKNETNFSGIVFEILDHLAETYQFSFELVQSPDDDYGVLTNGNWSGLIRMLMNQEVDMIAAALTVTKDRSTVVDFTNAFYTDPISIMIHMPEPEDMLWQLVGLFSPIIWINIFVASLISIHVIYVLHKYSAEPNAKYKFVGGLNSFRKCIWYVVCCLTNQGVDDQPTTWSGQNFLAFWSLSSFALISIYSGGLIAMLTTTHVTTSIKDLKSLIDAMESGEYTVCVENGTALYDTIMNTDSEDYTRIRNWLNKNPNYVQTNQVSCTYSFLRSPKMAYLAELTFLQQLQIRNCTEYPLIILNDQFSTGDFAFAVQKRSRLNALISPSVINAREGGLIDGWKQKYSVKNKFCDIKTPNQRVSAGMKALGLKTFGGAYVILAIGLVISIASFLGETHHELISNCTRSIWSKHRHNPVHLVTWKKNRINK